MSQHVPEADHDQEHHDREQPPGKADQEPGAEVRGRARAPEFQEIPQGALSREREVARQEKHKDPVDREERHEREVLGFRRASGQAGGKRNRDRQEENRREKSERGVAPPRLREAVESEGRAGARPGEADDNPCAPANEQEPKDQTIHSPGIPPSFDTSGRGKRAAASARTPGRTESKRRRIPQFRQERRRRRVRGDTRRGNQRVIPAG